jgi:hypothetical protein
MKNMGLAFLCGTWRSYRLKFYRKGRGEGAKGRKVWGVGEAERQC